ATGPAGDPDDPASCLDEPAYRNDIDADSDDHSGPRATVSRCALTPSRPGSVSTCRSASSSSRCRPLPSSQPPRSPSSQPAPSTASRTAPGRPAAANSAGTSSGRWKYAVVNRGAGPTFRPLASTRAAKSGQAPYQPLTSPSCSGAYRLMVA